MAYLVSVNFHWRLTSFLDSNAIMPALRHSVYLLLNQFVPLYEVAAGQQGRSIRES